MKLHRLHLVNFRQHADTELAFGDGLTGIIGPNGSGKTTLLEAIAWAIYGPAATRGDKDSIRNLRAKPRASVRVELEFALGKHEYRVVRGLNGAELYEDGRPLANSIREVSDKVERLLGMRYDEFFNTYFTGQKELAVMASLGGTERAQFLSRVLGYERLRDAQDRVRERRNAAAAELKGLEAGLPDRDDIRRAHEQAAQELEEARAGERRADTVRADADAAVERLAPEWREWERKRELAIRLDSDRRMAAHGVEAARHEFQRLDRELAEALHAQEQIRALQPDLEPIARLKDELATLERLQKEEAGRQADAAQLEELGRAATELERRLAELGDREAALAAAHRDVTAAARQLEDAEKRAEEQRGAWLTERTYADNKRTELLRQWEDVKEQLDRIHKLGPQGECPTCRRPLGDEFGAVIALLERQRDAITDDGKYFRQRLEQLSEEPAAVREADAARDAAAAEHTRAAEREGQVRAEAEERARGAQTLAATRKRAAAVEQRLRARPTGYDAARHDAVRSELARLEPVWREAARLEGIAGRAATLVKEAELAEKDLSRREESARQIEDAVSAQGFSEDAFRRAKERHDQALLTLKQAELSVAEARHALIRAEEKVREAKRREAERATREGQIAALRMEHRLHNELDRALSDLRGELNEQVRPEITELASGFLTNLTDGRYDEVELDEHYRVRVLDEGVPKPVISGGEEDVANLVLRLAISQMIAERAGQPLSLLVLDEIFGSLDDQRRGHVLSLLRRLADRFPQVVLITHVEGVREGLDRVLRVSYDAARAASVVRDDTATLGPADAGVAA